MRRPLRLVAMIAAGVVIAASAATAVVTDEQSASAAASDSPTTILKAFNPADIISDEVMFNPSTMSTAAIQTFLNGKVPTCRPGYTCLKNYTQTTTTKVADPMCSTYTGAKNETAATIISRVSKACGVNPQVLLVTLQKEQGLISDDWPGARQYRSATGYGCPDTAACDSDYYGFFNQVYKAAWAFKRYTTPKGTTGAGWTKYNWFPVGKPSGVLFNPDATCGASTITIKNKATATLYYFTPYQPNAAALAAGFGTGNGCSAYGNRNFFLYFTTWFGSTHYAVAGAIRTLWNAMGGSSSALGNPAANATTSKAAGGGTVQRFTNGSIYTSKAGTFAVTGAALAAYTKAGGPGGTLGWPKATAKSASQSGGGLVQVFTGGSIFSSAAGAHAVSGAIYTRYAKESLQAGRLKWPTGDVRTSTANGGGTWQTFSGGAIAAAKGGSGTTMTGSVLTKWIARGADRSTLGWPTALASTVKAGGVSGTVQQFQSGQVQVRGTSVYTVTGDIAKDYAVNKGVTGALGWIRAVSSSNKANGGGWSQRFTTGTIYYSKASGAHPLKGKELKLYNARGGTSGSLGWPGARKHDGARHGGYVTTFTNGRIYSSSATTAAVLGTILQKYLDKKGPSGVLGWPTGATRTVKGAQVQRFEHGSISYTAGGGAKASTS